MQINTIYTFLLVGNKLSQTGLFLYLWLLVTIFLSKLPNFLSKGFSFWCFCCFHGGLPPSSMSSVENTPFILLKLSPPSIFESTSSSMHSCSASVSSKNSFFSIVLLSYILNLISTPSLHLFLWTHLPSEKKKKKNTATNILLFILYYFNRLILHIILLVHNQINYLSIMVVTRAMQKSFNSYNKF